MKVMQRFIFAIILIVASALYIVPWHNYGVDTEFLNKPYTLGLDLQGGVELDYQVDFSTVRAQKDNVTTDAQIVEGLKRIVDKRVNSLGLAEPNIQTVKYGTETHIIVQIPTKAYADLTPEEQNKQRLLDIKKAKETIGKVVQLEFKEQKTQFSEEDYAARKEIAEKAKKELEENIPFATVAEKYQLQYEGVVAQTQTGALSENIAFTGAQDLTVFPHILDVKEVENPTWSIDESGNPIQQTNTGYIVPIIQEKSGTGFVYSYLMVDAAPSSWTPAKTADGRILSDQHLTQAAVSFTQSGNPQVSLTFNDAGKSIFSELTSRLIGKPIAIYVGGELITSPTVNDKIPNGVAVITGHYTVQEAKELASNIMTGIVPAPIYLTSERTIDAKIGESALEQILHAGAIGLIAILILMMIFYRVSGFLAGLALVAYTVFLIAIIKMTGVVLTLASIAGVILSIGLAIDANILIFERLREALRDGEPLHKAINIGFRNSWSAIWDSHVTSFTVAVILYIFGISMIKGFGLMLGIGILLSLFTAMWVSRVFILVFYKFFPHASLLIGKK